MKTRPLGGLPGDSSISSFNRPMYPRRVIDPTAEQKAEAIRLTKDAATTIRDLVRELDLPASAFESVLRLYANQEWMVVERAAIEEENRTEAKRQELVEKLRAKRVVFQPQGYGAPAGEFIPFGQIGTRGNDGLDFASIEELTELAKNVTD